jgi:uncharacterized membrane protein YfhO
MENIKETECTEINELLAKIEHLKQENEQLTLDRDYYKSTCIELHNILENQNKPDESNDRNEYVEEFLNNDAIMYCYNQAYEMASLRK